MTNGGKEMLLDQLFILAVGCCMQLNKNSALPSAIAIDPDVLEHNCQQVNLSHTHSGLFRRLRKR